MVFGCLHFKLVNHHWKVTPQSECHLVALCCNEVLNLPCPFRPWRAWLPACTSSAGFPRRSWSTHWRWGWPACPRACRRSAGGAGTCRAVCPGWTGENSGKIDMVNHETSTKSLLSTAVLQCIQYQRSNVGNRIGWVLLVIDTAIYALCPDIVIIRASKI